MDQQIPQSYLNALGRISSRDIKPETKEIEQPEEQQPVIEEEYKKDATYQEYFKQCLKDMGVKDISELDDEQKKEFFKKLDAKWKAKNEEVEQSEEKLSSILEYKKVKKTYKCKGK